MEKLHLLIICQSQLYPFVESITKSVDKRIIITTLQPEVVTISDIFKNNMFLIVTESNLNQIPSDIKALFERIARRVDGKLSTKVASVIVESQDTSFAISQILSCLLDLGMIVIKEKDKTKLFEKMKNIALAILSYNKE